MSLLHPSEVIQDTHLKSILDITLENSMKQLDQLRERLAKDPSQLAKKEREFMIKECAKLQSIGKLQVNLDKYRESQKKLNPGQREKDGRKSASSEKLGDYLRAIGKFKLGANWQAHHIVCSKHPSHGASRLILYAYLGINDPWNGCWLPTKHKYATGTVLPNAVGHAYLHTTKYAEWVYDEMRPVFDKDSLIRQLGEIRLRLIDARNLPDILTEDGKKDLRTHY